MLGERHIKSGHEVSVLSSGGELEKDLAAKGFKILNYPIRCKSILHPKLYFALPKIIKVVQEEKFDLLHAHTRVTQVLAWFISRKTKIPALSTAHGFYKRGLGRRLFPAWGRLVIAISPLVAEELEKSHKVPKKNIRVVFNGIDMEAQAKLVKAEDALAIRESLGIPPDSFVIGCISRLVQDKGHEYLLRAAALLKKTKSNIFVLMVGDGREKERILKLIGTLGLKSEARLLPSEKRLHPFFSIMDVFVHPATFKEGFGLTILEAMACKIPVVATDIWALNSIIRNRVNGYLVQPKDEKELANTLAEIMNQPVLAKEIALNGFEMASQSYSADRMAKETETVYKEVARSLKVEPALLSELNVVFFESRLSKTMGDLIRLQGGAPHAAPSMKEAPLHNNTAVFEFGENLLKGEVPVLILLTGVGTRVMVEALETRHKREDILEALKKTTLIPRGPKPIRVLKEWNIPNAVTVPETNTWREILQTLDECKDTIPIQNRLVAVQEYGVTNENLLNGLAERGAEVLPVPIYRWALPDDLEPLQKAIQSTVAGEMQIAVFTTAVQIVHVLQVAKSMGLEEPLKTAFQKMVIASVGPDCSEELRASGIPVDIEPASPKMGPLVQEIAKRSREVLKKNNV